MQQGGCQKQEIRRGDLSLSNGGSARTPSFRRARRESRTFTTAEIRLDMDMKEVVGSIRGADGRYPTRAFQRVLYEEAFPWRMIARFLVSARRAHAPKAQAMRVVSRLAQLVDELWKDAPKKAA